MRKLQAILEISNFFVQGGGCTCTLFPMDEVLSEERQLMKRMGIFQVGIFQVEFDGWEFSWGEFS